MKIPNRNLYLILFLTVFISYSVHSQSDKKFVLILDAGHGGKDPGNSYHGYVEKDIALKTTLKVGEYLEKEKDFKIIYTRVNDEFIELAKRPKIANKANANLFVSIHCNSVKNFGPSGTETFVMGLSRSNMNLEVAKSENSVIYLEDNYKETYKGFDPKKPETLLGITMVKEENLNNSIHLASKIQDNFTSNLKRKTRGVKQQPLWVLDASVMPGVLIELGFLSNEEEGAYLNSKEGQNKMARQIADAIIEYKKDYFGESGSNSISNNDKPEIKAVNSETKSEGTTIKKTDIVFKVQIAASSKKLALVSKNFKGLKNISVVKTNTLYKYSYGETLSYETAKKLKLEAENKGYKESFIIAFKNGKSVDVKEYIK
jgi:N-acetylmuramoyl-L-alanine amidase